MKLCLISIVTLLGCSGGAFNVNQAIENDVGEIEAPDGLIGEVSDDAQDGSSDRSDEPGNDDGRETIGEVAGDNSGAAMDTQPDLSDTDEAGKDTDAKVCPDSEAVNACGGCGKCSWSVSSYVSCKEWLDLKGCSLSPGVGCIVCSGPNSLTCVKC